MNIIPETLLFSDNVRIYVYPALLIKVQNNCPGLCCYRFVQSFYIYQIPEKLYILVNDLI